MTRNQTFNRRLRNCLAFWLGFALVSLTLLFWLYLSGIQAHGPARIAPVEVKKAMRYHGVMTAEYRGEWGFRRHGKWCSLFRSMKEGE